MLSIGIVGLPNVGKSTLFNSLTKKQVAAENYPFCTIEPNVGVVAVPDERHQPLCQMSQSQKIVPAAIEFIDIAGLVQGAASGEGLGNKFLSHIRNCDAICQVVRGFSDGQVIHVGSKIDPRQDSAIINLELMLADLQTVTKRLDKVRQDSKSGDKKIAEHQAVLQKIKTWLEAEKPIRELELTDKELPYRQELNLLTSKPLLYVLNTDDNQNQGLSVTEPVIKLNAKLEADIAGLPETEQAAYIQELGLQQSGLDKLIQAAYQALGLISFLTTGKDETRAWTIIKGTKAPQAAGVIHTDFIKGFVRAEVINWQELLRIGSETEAKAKGLIRIEGKDYQIQDGDVCNFLINS